MRYEVYDYEKGVEEVVESFDTLAEAKRFVLEDIAHPEDCVIVDSESEEIFYTLNEGLTWEGS